MKVELDIRPLPGFPRLEGAHALSWSYLLDHVFADAYTQRLETLRMVLPSPQLEEEVALRCGRAPTLTGFRGTGLAMLDGGPFPPSQAERLYGLEFGVLAPFALRSKTKPTTRPPHHANHRISVYTLQARLLGLPLRLALTLNRPDLYDRTTFRLRHAFAHQGHTPAYYHLSTWCLRSHTSLSSRSLT